MASGDAALGTASLWNSLDKKLLCELRDGQVLIGYLRSIDQFGPLPPLPPPTAPRLLILAHAPAHPQPPRPPAAPPRRRSGGPSKRPLLRLTPTAPAANLVLEETVERVVVGPHPPIPAGRRSPRRRRWATSTVRSRRRRRRRRRTGADVGRRGAGDILRGVYLIRGENVVLIGEIVTPSSRLRARGRRGLRAPQDPDKEDNEGLREVGPRGGGVPLRGGSGRGAQVSTDVILEKSQLQKEAKVAKHKALAALRLNRGLHQEGFDDVFS